MKFKNIVFDADGVICTGGMFTEHLEREHGIKSVQLDSFFKENFPFCILGQKDLRSEIAPILNGIGWTYDVDRFLDFWFRSESVVDARVLGVVASLRTRGVRCFLGTNQEQNRLAYMRRNMEFDQVFDHVFASCELGAAKPASDYFTRVAEKISSRAEDILLIDDSIKNVEGARSVGWNAIHYKHFDDLAFLQDEGEPDAAAQALERTPG
jgi:putative hydrolase of the HAD superfamily